MSSFQTIGKPFRRALPFAVSGMASRTRSAMRSVTQVHFSACRALGHSRSGLLTVFFVSIY